MSVVVPCSRAPWVPRGPSSAAIEPATRTLVGLAAPSIISLVVGLRMRVPARLAGTLRRPTFTRHGKGELTDATRMEAAKQQALWRCVYQGC
jgi:hypothetical protein